MLIVNQSERKKYTSIKVSALGNLAELTQGKLGYGSDMRGKLRGAMRMMRIVIIIRMMMVYRF